MTELEKMHVRLSALESALRHVDVSHLGRHEFALHWMDVSDKQRKLDDERRQREAHWQRHRDSYGALLGGLIAVAMTVVVKAALPSHFVDASVGEGLGVLIGWLFGRAFTEKED